MNNRGIQQFIQVARRLPPKYWVLLGVLALVYFFAEPKLEAMLGQRLPGFNDNQTPLTAENSSERTSAGKAYSNPRETRPSQSNKDQAKSEPRLGQLTEVGGRVFESTAGLRYTPGSQEGHRLDHLLRHTTDQPNRPGSHGVFDGGREGMLAVLDEAYLLALKHGRGVQVQHQDGRTVYTVDLQRRVGFIGGQTGQRHNNPGVNRVRLVLDGSKVITAYPYR
jgi:hypothetical protein